jgi:uncharacterized protein DUF4242
MKRVSLLTVFAAAQLFGITVMAQPSKFKKDSETTPVTTTATKKFFIDVHHFGPGKVREGDVAVAHQKDLAIESKFGVDIINYWLDQTNGDVYCLASAPDSQALISTHAEAHGLLPDKVLEVTSSGSIEPSNKRRNLYLDIHQFGPGKVTAKDVAAAHQKDLAVQEKYGVNFINYWVDEKNGTVMCLAQANNAEALINTHKEAHGLIPDKVIKVKQRK